MNEFKQSIISSFLCFSLLSCQPTTEIKRGTIRLIATDAPFNYDTVASAKITVSKIMMRKQGDNKITVMEREVTLDLLQLRNGLVESLAQLEIPVGEYNEVILIISEASVDLKDGRQFPLTVPSGASSGLKVFVKPAITVSEKLTSELLLDFDLSRSFVAHGDGFSFSPVIRAANLAMSGSVSGVILSDNNTPSDPTDDTAIPGALVTISRSGEIVSTAVTDERGYYKILGLEALTYTMSATGDSFTINTINSLVISVGNDTQKDFSLTPSI